MTPVGDAFQVPQYKLRMREGNQSAQDVCVPLQTLPTVSVAPTLTSRLPSAVLRPRAPRLAVTCWSGASPNAACVSIGPTPSSVSLGREERYADCGRPTRRATRASFRRRTWEKSRCPPSRATRIPSKTLCVCEVLGGYKRLSFANTYNTYLVRGGI